MNNNNTCFLNNIKDCFDENDINILVKLFNSNLHKPICNTNTNKCILPLTLIDTTISHKEQLKILKKQLKKIIKNNTDIVDLSFINDLNNNHPELYVKFKYLIFKPKKPQSNWLSDGDINKVMFQYTTKYPELYFYGAVPCNFYEYTDINYNKIFNTPYTAFIINTQKQGHNGEHWTCLFIDNNEKHIEYYDSFGKTPNKYISHFIDILYKHSSYHIYINDIKHQKNNTQCGVFAIYYILQRLKNKTIYDIVFSNINDSKMKKIRNQLYLN